MDLRYCAHCNCFVQPRRDLGAGTLILGLITCGWWLITLPLYQKKCPNCKGTNFTNASFLGEIEKIINEYKNTLGNEKLKCTKKDPYGNLICDSWFKKEIPYFIENVLRKRIYIPDNYLVSITNYINELADSHISTQHSNMPYNDDFTGIDYELYCLKILKDNGWDATLTKASGDQGVDIVASKNGNKVVFQCKKYSSAVGNKAVQEISAGRIHYSANHAIVVTNNKFTESAYQLASTNRVILLHHNDLFNLDNIIY